MAGAGLRVESAKGECNYGQHEIAFRYADALTCADGHAIYKNGAKEIAAQGGCSLTFMSKYNEREGNSCHIHFSLRGDDGAAVFADGELPFAADNLRFFAAVYGKTDEENLRRIISTFSLKKMLNRRAKTCELHPTAKRHRSPA